MSKSRPYIISHPFPDSPICLIKCPLGAEIFKKLNKVSRHIEKNIYNPMIYEIVFTLIVYFLVFIHLYTCITLYISRNKNSSDSIYIIEFTFSIVNEPINRFLE